VSGYVVEVTAEDVWWVVKVGVLLVGGSRRWKTRSECCSQESSGSASTREANKSVSQAPDRQKPARHYVIRLPPRFFRAFLVAIHMSHAARLF